MGAKQGSTAREWYHRARLRPPTHTALGVPRRRAMIYPFFRPLLFALDPETAHDLAFASLDVAARFGLAQALARRAAAVAGHGDGAHVSRTASDSPPASTRMPRTSTASPRSASASSSAAPSRRAPQPGNPKPRLFRLPEAEALINRLGFNNDGVERFLANAARASWRGILGLNIGKNFDTPNARAVDDYLACLRAVYARASYVTVNVSSPNTKGLRDLQSEEALAALLGALKAEQKALADRHGKYTPIAVKIAPDLTPTAIDGIARLLVRHKVDGVIATNTTIARDAVKGLPHADEAGGLVRPAAARAGDRRRGDAREGARRRAADHRRGRHPLRRRREGEDRRRRDAGADLHRTHLPRPGSRRRVRAGARGAEPRAGLRPAGRASASCGADRAWTSILPSASATTTPS